MRTELISALTLSFPEYNVYHGFIANAAAVKLVLPALWVLPLDLLEHDLYSCQMYLMQQDRKCTENEKAEMWDSMESAVLSALDSLRKNPTSIVADISGIRCYPDEHSLTSFGEISLKVTFNITLARCDS